MGDEFAEEEDEVDGDDGDEDSNGEKHDTFFSNQVSAEDTEEGGAMMEFIPQDESNQVDYDKVIISCGLIMNISTTIISYHIMS